MVCRECRSLETGNHSWGSLETFPKRGPGYVSSSRAGFWSRTAHVALQETFQEVIQRGQPNFQLVGSEAALPKMSPQLSRQALQLLLCSVLLLPGLPLKLSRETRRTTTYRAISTLFILSARLSWPRLRYFRALEPVPHNLPSIPAAGRCVFLPTSPAEE